MMTDWLEPTRPCMDCGGRQPEDMPWLAPPAMLSRAVLTWWPARSLLVRAGEQTRRMDVLVEGMTEEIVGGLVLRSTEPGTLLGATRAPGDAPAPGTIRAVTDVVLLTAPVRALHSLTGIPEVEHWLAEQMHRRAADIRRGASLRLSA
jgi:CRP-like cAMP-binding protein